MFTEILLIALLFLLYIYWSDSLKAREIALYATRKHCAKLEIQLLDECVALNGFWFRRNQQGKLLPWRSYLFEFSSTGEERYNGKIILLGNRVQSFELDPYRINE